MYIIINRSNQTMNENAGSGALCRREKRGAHGGQASVTLADGADLVVPWNQVGHLSRSVCRLCAAAETAPALLYSIIIIVEFCFVVARTRRSSAPP